MQGSLSPIAPHRTSTPRPVLQLVRSAQPSLPASRPMSRVSTTPGPSVLGKRSLTTASPSRAGQFWHGSSKPRLNFTPSTTTPAKSASAQDSTLSFHPDSRIREASNAASASEYQRLCMLQQSVRAQADVRRSGVVVINPIVFTTLDGERLEKLPLASDLLAYMPSATLRSQLGLSEDEMSPSELSKRLKVFMLHGLPTWSSGTLRGAKNTWLRLLSWAPSANFDVSQGIITARAVLEFLHFVKTTAVKNAQLREAARPASTTPMGVARTTRRRNHGLSAAPTALRHLRWLVRNMGFDITITAFIKSSFGSRNQFGSDGSCAFTPFILLQLEFHASNPNNTVFVRAACSFLVWCAYSGSRFKQAQLSTVVEEDWADTGCDLGVCDREKHPRPDKAQPRGWTCPRLGLSSSEDWRQGQKEMFQDLQSVSGDVNFMMRDFDSITGCPHLANTWLDQPMSTSRMTKMCRSILVHPVGLSPDQADAFGASSGHAFFSEAARALHLGASDRQQVGHWSQSVYASPGLTPPQRHAADYEQRMLQLPDIYAHSGVVHAAVLCTTILSSMRAWLCDLRATGNQLPKIGGWKELSEFALRTRTAPLRENFSDEEIDPSFSSSDDSSDEDGPPAVAGSTHAATQTCPEGFASSVLSWFRRFWHMD